MSLFDQPAASMSTEQLVTTLVAWNAVYRAGNEIVSDATYDAYKRELARREPDHELVTAVEPEPAIGRPVEHPVDAPMLSTDKAYTADDIAAYVGRCAKAAAVCGIDPRFLVFSITPKLDGSSARHDPARPLLATRGDGLVGNDISHLLGVVKITGDQGEPGPGEIVVDINYYRDANLADVFANERAFVNGIVTADVLNEHAAEAGRQGAIHFVKFSSLPEIRVSGDELVERIDELTSEAIATVPQYLTDGIVIRVTDQQVQRAMGKSSDHWRWMVARKTIGETADATVESLTWQVGRTGRITPVINIAAVTIGGVVIRNVTAHNAANVIGQGIGPGATGKIVRSGEVIPKWIETTARSNAPAVPDACPCCSTPLVWAGVFLECPGDDCSAKSGSAIEHFAKTVGLDLLGPKATERLTSNGITAIEQVLSLTGDQLVQFGFGPGQAKNIIAELERLKREPLDDFRLLAGLGIRHLGRGSSRRLLSEIHLTELLNVGAEDIGRINGFGGVTAVSIATDLASRAETLRWLLSCGLTIKHQMDFTPASTVMAGVSIVFTGAMSVSRDEMATQARNAGAVVQSSVSGKTSYLVAGANVGASKLNKAREMGVTVLTEAEYRERFGV